MKKLQFFLILKSPFGIYMEGREYQTYFLEMKGVSDISPSLCSTEFSPAWPNK